MAQPCARGSSAASPSREGVPCQSVRTDRSSGSSDLRPDIAVLTALPVERQGFLAALGPRTVHRWHGQDVHLADVAGERVLVPPAGMGDVGMAALARRVLGGWKRAACGEAPAHFGPAFSGEKVLADARTVTGLRTTWSKAVLRPAGQAP